MPDCKIFYYRQRPPPRLAARFWVPALFFAFGTVFLPRLAAGQAVTAPLKAMPNPALQNRALSSYDEKVTRLAEILGSLHYLYNLCGAENSEWRDYMQKLITALHPDDKQRVRLYAAFNRSYEAFGGNYGMCTKAAKEAVERYRLEGQNLSRYLVEHFGNDPSAP